MPQATLTAPAFINLPPDALLRAVRVLTEASVAAVQSALLASLLWLILAGPGFLI